ncbi:MAG: D-2-hydroxyacid dehydrogenase [Lachnospiraceae bacterium]|nr:D-2-hydroxyacid dehydrogenase [Lachnospiraceae bacterium]
MNKKIVALELKNIGADVDLSHFGGLGEFEQYPTTPLDKIPERIKDAEIVIVNKLPMQEETLKDAGNLKLLCETATGTDNIDIPYCKSRGITVCNVKGYSTANVVQHTFASFFYIYEKLRHYDDYVKLGKYAESDIFTYFENKFHELAGKTWGIVGLGEIGRGVARVASAFGCKVIYYSTSGRNDTKDYERVDFDALLSRSDVISIHAPLNDNTRYLFSQTAFEKMKPTAYLLNMGRGPIVDEKALVSALNENRIAGAALDVIEKEPMAKDSVLLTFKDSDRLLVTPHIAWASVEARQRLMDEVYSNIEAFLKGEKRNVVGG